MIKPDSMSLLSTDNDSFGKISFFFISIASMKGHNYGCIAYLHQCAKFFSNILPGTLSIFVIFLRFDPFFNHQIIFLTLLLSRYYRSATEMLTRCYRCSNKSSLTRTEVLTRFFQRSLTRSDMPSWC